jgi:hypothetical protein
MDLVPLRGVGGGGLLCGRPGRAAAAGAERAGAEQRAADHRAGAKDGCRDPGAGGAAVDQRIAARAAPGTAR